MDWVLAHDYTRTAHEKYQSKGLEGGKVLRRAAHYLCLSCSKSLNASKIDNQRIAVGGQPSATSPPTTVQTPYPLPASVKQNDKVGPATTATGGRSIRISLCDPDLSRKGKNGQYPWYGNGLVEIRSTMLAERSYLELARACRKYVPKNRSLQGILGATGDPAENSNTVTLGDDEEVQAWLQVTEQVRPLRVLAILDKRIEKKPEKKNPRPAPTVVSIQSACLTTDRGGGRSECEGMVNT